MGRLFVLWGGFGTLVGAVLAIVTLKGGFDWRPILMLGAIGAVVGSVGAVVVRVSAPAHPSPTNFLAMAGAVVGAVGGGPLGAMTGLGQPLLALFNPDLPPLDFQPVFGAVGGVIVGAGLGALAGAAFSRTRGKKAELNDAEASR